MKNKTIISFISIFIVQFLFSCICNCPSPKGFSFDFDNLIYANSIEKYPKIDEIAFAVVLKDSSKLIVSNQPKGAFLTTAMACKCNNSTYGILKSPIKAIKIFTKYDFNSKFKAGSDISELFVGNENYNQYSTELYFNLVQLPQKLNDLKYEFFPYSTQERIGKQVSFYLKNKPKYPNNKFTIKFEFENGITLETETEEFLRK